MIYVYMCVHLYSRDFHAHHPDHLNVGGYEKWIIILCANVFILPNAYNSQAFTDLLTNIMHKR